MAELCFRQAVKVGDEGVTFRAKLCAFDKVQCAEAAASVEGGVGVRLHSDLEGEVVELRRGADEPRRPVHYGEKRGVFFCQSGGGSCVNKKERNVSCYTLPSPKIKYVRVEYRAEKQT